MARRVPTGTGGGAAGALVNKGGPIRMEMTGVAELEKLLGDVSPKSANRIMKNTLNDMARDIRKEMRRRAPKDEGTLRKAIKTYSPKQRGNLLKADVWITHGKNTKYDAYYWHIIEWGSVNHTAQPFIKPSTEEFRQRQPRIMREAFGKRYEKEMQRLAKSKARR